nr:hypothetical protein [uncultured Roseovarius sp.]
MNTPAHLIFAAAAFAKPGAPRRTWAALAGALAPDLSLYVMSIWALYVQGLDPGHVFGTLYFSDSWQNVFRVDNSFLVWGGAAGDLLVARQRGGHGFCRLGALASGIRFSAAP